MLYFFEIKIDLERVLLIIPTILIFLIVEIFTPFLVFLIAPGFYEDGVKFNLAVEFTRITFPFLLFILFILLILLFY